MTNALTAVNKEPALSVCEEPGCGGGWVTNDRLLPGLSPGVTCLDLGEL